MSKLTHYLAKEGLTQRAFAARVSVDPSIISRLTREEMTPGLQLAVDIERETNGFVPASSWVEASLKRAG
ncbi:helix-turn-helix domain-containing protein [Paracoccus haematequi]|nr:helix-turn-helix transcriptional regulator [Paracoccus haematequi]